MSGVGLGASAWLNAGMATPARGQAPTHSSATHLVEDRDDMWTIQELRGRNDDSTTMISTPILNRGGHGVDSQADCL